MRFNIVFSLLMIFISQSVFGQTNDYEQVIEQWSGSCVAIGNNIVATNYHVVDNANNLFVVGHNGDKKTKYRAEVLLTDKINDLAVMRITDERFSGFNIKYGLNDIVSDIGTSVFVLGYPLTTTMGEDIKLTTGVISSKSGFQGNKSQYQISAPIQPGNSGGPLFDDKGDLIGIVSAKHLGAENVGYAIKLNYLRNLLDSSMEPIPLNSKNTISSLSLPNKIKAISSCVLMVLANTVTTSSRNLQQEGKDIKPETKRGGEPNAIIAHKYMVAGKEDLAFEYYKKVDINRLDKVELNEYARCAYFTGHFQDALNAAEEGILLDPRKPLFNRIAMFSNYELKNYEEAKSYIYKYFNETDNATISEYDHYYAALIYQALDDKANMYTQYDKALELVNDSSMIKRWDIQKAVSDSYLKDQEFDKAIKYYNDMLACKPNVNFDDEEGLANIYSKWGEADPAKKNEYVKKAVEIFRAAGQKYPIQEVYATYMAASTINKIDDNMKQSLAKPDYLKVIELLANKADRTKGDNTMLKTAYHYMMFNSYINKNVAGAKDYAEKILVIDPEYKPALEIKNLK